MEEEGFGQQTQVPGSPSFHRPLYDDSRNSTDHIDAHMLFSLNDASQNDAWSYLNFNFNVTQNFIKDPVDTAPMPENTAQTTQKLLKNFGHDGKHVHEVAVSISIKNTKETKNRRYQFQLFCSVIEDDALRRSIPVSWTRLEVCTFVTIRGTNRPLQPINRKITKSEVAAFGNEVFLGSFSYDGRVLAHVLPSYPHHRTQNRDRFAVHVSPTVKRLSDEVIILDKCDMQREPKRARAGRPRHKKTQQLLMTRDQVEKILELRERWEGMTRRQRKFNIKEADIYPFLTLGRDECSTSLMVCPTWFKEVIRSHGIKVWPGRPLRKSGAELEDLKAQLATARATVHYSREGTQVRASNMRIVTSLSQEINQKVEQRMKIVESLVTSEYYSNFVQGDGRKYLNPEWVALPLSIPAENSVHDINYQ